MNTGIQDAANLAWKLAETLRGHAAPTVLDTYHTERAPVGRMVLRFTDRAFTIATSTNPLIRFARTRIAPTLIPLVLEPRVTRSYAFRTVSQLTITYRASPLSTNGPRAPRHGPKAGDRLPDVLLLHNGQNITLHEATARPGWHLLLCGPPSAWTAQQPALPVEGPASAITVYHLTTTAAPDALHDADGGAHRRLGLTPGDIAQYLVRPDGHIGYRSGGTDLNNLRIYLRRWLPAATS